MPILLTWNIWKEYVHWFFLLKIFLDYFYIYLFPKTQNLHKGYMMFYLERNLNVSCINFSLIRWCQPQNLIYLKVQYLCYSSRARSMWLSNSYSKWLWRVNRMPLSASISHSLFKSVTADLISLFPLESSIILT